MNKKSERVYELLFKKLMEDVTFRFTMSYGKHADELTIVLKGHLFVEYLLDIIIKNKFKRPNLVSNYKFTQKLDIVYSLDLIPTYLYNNILYLNGIRNKFAHNLKYNISKERLTLFKPDGSTIELNNKFIRYSSRKKIGTFCGAILTQLNVHLINNLGISPVFK